jgi:hypothetical protein
LEIDLNAALFKDRDGGGGEGIGDENARGHIGTYDQRSSWPGFSRPSMRALLMKFVDARASPGHDG